MTELRLVFFPRSLVDPKRKLSSVEPELVNGKRAKSEPESSRFEPEPPRFQPEPPRFQPEPPRFQPEPSVLGYLFDEDLKYHLLLHTTVLIVVAFLLLSSHNSIESVSGLKVSFERLILTLKTILL